MSLELTLKEFDIVIYIYIYRERKRNDSPTFFIRLSHISFYVKLFFYFKTVTENLLIKKEK
jgi:hypothetical protein